MILDFVRTGETKAIGRFSLKQLVDEISRFHGPAFWYINFLKIDLFRENLISNVLASLTCIGPSSQHQLMSYYPKCEIVDLHAMVLTTHNFRSHISWRSRGIVSIVRCPDT